MQDILGLTMDNTLSLLLSCSIKIQGQNLLILKLAAVNDIAKGYPANHLMFIPIWPDGPFIGKNHLCALMQYNYAPKFGIF